MDVPIDQLRSARDEIKTVLEPYIGQERALERANNIAQALMFPDDEDPVTVAFDMLLHMPIKDIWSVASQVAEAWQTVVPKHVEKVQISKESGSAKEYLAEDRNPISVVIPAVPVDCEQLEETKQAVGDDT